MSNLYNSLCVTFSNRSVIWFFTPESKELLKKKITQKKYSKRKQIKAFSNIILPNGIQTDQFHLAVKKPCQLHVKKKLRVYSCVCTAGQTLRLTPERKPRAKSQANPVLQARDNPLERDDSSFNTKPLQNLSDVESYESGSVPKRTEADKLEFE